MIRVKGHALRAEGALWYQADGTRFEGGWSAWVEARDRGGLRAKCECGELSPPEVTSGSQAKQWHRRHKAEVISHG